GHRQGAKRPRAIKPRHEGQRELSVTFRRRSQRLLRGLRLVDVVEVEPDVQLRLSGGAVLRGAREHRLHLIGENVLAGADHLEDLTLGGLARRVPGGIDVRVPVVLLVVIVLSGGRVAEHLLDLFDRDRRLRRHADLGHDEGDVAGGVVPGLAVVSVGLELAESGGGPGQLRVDVPLGQNAGRLLRLGRRRGRDSVVEGERGDLRRLPGRAVVASLGLVSVVLVRGGWRREDVWRGVIVTAGRSSYFSFTVPGRRRTRGRSKTESALNPFSSAMRWTVACQRLRTPLESSGSTGLASFQRGCRPPPESTTEIGSTP